MRRIRAVRGDEVRPGDELFNNKASHPAFQWIRVVAVEPTIIPLDFGPFAPKARGVKIATTGWDTYVLAAEGIAVRRETEE